MNISQQLAVQQIMNLRQGRKDWYKIRAQAGGTVITIYDEVGYFGVTAKDFTADVEAVRGDIELHIGSPGGELFEGLAIYNCLSQRDGQVRVVVDSLAGSICSVIAQAASPGQLVMTEASSMMIHDASAVRMGNAGDLREMADLLDKQSDVIASVYASRSGMPAAHWREQMRAETWYSAAEAVDAGLADEVRQARPGSPRNAAAAPVPTFDPAVIRDAFEGGTR